MMDNAIDYLKALWIEVIGIPDVEAESNFFELGGDSLQMMTMLFRIQDDRGIELSPGDVFDNPTVMSLASLLAGPTVAAR